MTIALVTLFTVVVFAAGFLLWKSRDTWRWFHITGSAITLILAITLLFPTAGVLKSRMAWNKLKEGLDKQLATVEAEEALLKYGDPGAQIPGVLDLQTDLQRYALEAGRRWPNLRMQGNKPDSITLLGAGPAELPPGVAADEAPAAAPAAAAQPLIPEGLVVYGFADGPEPGSPSPVPSFFLGEFKVTASTPSQVTLAPLGKLEADQLQEISSGKAQSWTVYELLPLDGHVPFIALGSEPSDDAIFGRVDEELVRRLLGKSVSEATLTEYLRDGGRVKNDDPPSVRWQKIEFVKPHSIVVDSPEKRNVLDGGFFDSTGQAVDSRLQRGGDDGSVKFKVADQIIVSEEAATEMITLGVAKLLDIYFVRELHDYRFVLRRTRLRIAELTLREQELQYQAQVLQDAIDATLMMLTTNQDAKLKLEKDLAQLQIESKAIRNYTAKLTDTVAETRQQLIGIYRDNLQLAEELKTLHQGIANSLP